MSEYRELLASKNYLRVLTASLINRLGDALDAIACAWIVYQITQNAMWSAIYFTANRLPGVLVTPFAGVFVEKHAKKRIMVVTDLVRGLCVGVLALSYFTNHMSALLFVIMSLIISTAEAFRLPAGTAVYPLLMDKEHYEKGMTLMNAASTGMELVGTAGAAGLIALLSTGWVMGLDMLSFVLSACILAGCDWQERPVEIGGQKEAFVSGLKYLKRDGVIRYFIVFAMFLNAMFVPFNSLQAAMAEEILHGGAEVLSILGTSLSVGMLAGMSVYPLLKKYVKGKWMIRIGGIYTGVYYILMTMLTHFGVVVVLSCLVGFAVALMNSFASIELMKRIDSSYLARVSAITTSLTQAVVPFVSFLLVFITTGFSVLQIFAASGVITIVVMLVLGHRMPEMKTENV